MDCLWADFQRKRGWRMSLGVEWWYQEMKVREKVQCVRETGLENIWSLGDEVNEVNVDYSGTLKYNLSFKHSTAKIFILITIGNSVSGSAFMKQEEKYLERNEELGRKGLDSRKISHPMTDLRSYTVYFVCTILTQVELFWKAWYFEGGSPQRCPSGEQKARLGRCLGHLSHP